MWQDRMMSEDYNFSRSDFPLHCKTLLERVLSQTEFQDVTLVSDDQQFIKAHKIILGVSSEYFRNILTLQTHQQPFIVLKGITKDILDSIVAFIYLGETSLPQQSVDSFVEAAKFLKIKGLIEEQENDMKERTEQEENVEKSSNDDINTFNGDVEKQKSQEILNEDEDTNDSDIDNEQFQEILLAKQNEPIEINLEDEEETNSCGFSNSMEDDSVELVDVEDTDPDVETHFCDKCDFESSKSEEYTEHMRTEHVNDISCKECHYYAKDRQSLKEHMMITHKGIRCNNCSHKFSDLTLLRRHIRSNDDCMSKLLN